MRRCCHVVKLWEFGSKHLAIYKYVCIYFFCDLEFNVSLGCSYSASEGCKLPIGAQECLSEILLCSPKAHWTGRAIPREGKVQCFSCVRGMWQFKTSFFNCKTNSIKLKIYLFFFKVWWSVVPGLSVNW